MRRPLQVLTFRVIPTVVVVGLVGSTIFGQNGLLEMWTLEREVEALRSVQGQTQRDNALRELRLQHQESDPLVLERLVADELGLVPEGATLYEFEPRRGY